MERERLGSTEGESERNEKKEVGREGGKEGRNGTSRSPGPGTGLQLQFWSTLIQMVFNLVFQNTVSRS